MRALLALACFAIAGCGLSDAPADRSSVTVTLPPPTDVAARPGFSVPPAEARR